VTENAVGEGARYWAFISYSHKDAAFGRRLHRRLENYSLPRRLVGRVTAQGPLPRRLVPIFRDRDELPAANDLSAEVRAALQASRSLVVVCSPAGAASMWVAREVELFRSLHPDRPVLAALVEGDPVDSFSEALRLPCQGSAPVEPLAADFRATGDGKRLGLLKLVAGIIGIGLDELIQRDAQRRMQSVTAVTVIAIAAMLVMSVLTVFALNARTEAVRQRTQAEGLVEFMLTDLRATLKGVGRLDAMTAVNQRALRYYGDQELDRLPPESLERRARILHAMGEDNETRGDHDAALAQFREARRTTAALLAAAPNDPERIFAQAQSEFWIGFVDYQQNRFSAAKPAFQAYKRLADQLVSIAPNDPRYLREAGYAEGNLCSIALKPPKDLATALKSCSAALEHMEMAARRLGASGGIAEDLANRHGWLADVYRANGDRDLAMAHRLIQERILNGLMQADPQNMHLKSSWITVQRILAWMDAVSGQQKGALARLQRATSISDQMIAFDSSNKMWVQQRAKLDSDIAQIIRMPSERKKQ
jgi:tetratricopeptide (TPR) repeat protein